MQGKEVIVVDTAMGLQAAKLTTPNPSPDPEPPTPYQQYLCEIHFQGLGTCVCAPHRQATQGKEVICVETAMGLQSARSHFTASSQQSVLG